VKAIGQFWDDAIVPALIDYIRIPAKSPHFDRDWQKHGYIEDAAKLAALWCEKHQPAGTKLEIVRLEGRTPCLLLDVPGVGGDPVLMYGHLDKQPEMTGWRDDLGPWKPVIQDGKLYGRGGADDGYAVFCAIAALRQLQEDKRPHRRCVILIECCEESGRERLPCAAW
jgi:acetylornithine deacetylase/succinyl-diaminopimelate desuccinylase-like protein